MRFWISKVSSGDPKWQTRTKAAFHNARLFVVILQDEYFQQEPCLDELLWFFEAFCSVQEGDDGPYPQLVVISVREHDIEASRTRLLARLTHLESEMPDKMGHSPRVLLSGGFPFNGQSHTEFLSHAGRKYFHYDEVKHEGYLNDLFVNHMADRIITMAKQSSRKFSGFCNSTLQRCMPEGADSRKMPEANQSQSTSRKKHVIRIGVVPLMSNALNLRQKLSDEFQQLTEKGYGSGCQFDVVEVKDYRQVVDKLVSVDANSAERIDAAFLGPAAFTSARNKLSSERVLQPVAARLAPENKHLASGWKGLSMAVGRT